MKRKRCDQTRLCGCRATKSPSSMEIEKHEAEVTRRMVWCLKNGKTPANLHVHKAPGDDDNFVYKVPPWLPDGSVNPCGVYTEALSYEEKAFVKLHTEKDKEWICKSCKEIVHARPREFISKNGEPEPWNWWFCLKCKATKSKPSKKEIRTNDEIKHNRSILEWMPKKQLSDTNI